MTETQDYPTGSDSEPASTDTSTAETSLHELEQDRQARIPHRRTADDRDVLVERQTNNSLLVAATDGHLVGPFKRGSEQVKQGRRTLNSVLFPFSVMTKRRGKVTIQPGKKFYLASEDVHVKPEHASVDEDGRLYVTFQETGSSFPRRSWTFTTETIARYIEQDRLRSPTEIDERTREMLASMQEDS